MKIFLPILDNGNQQVMVAFMSDFFHAFRDRDVELYSASDSHANRGMNKIANDFLASDCDVWINIDADIRFRRVDVDALLSHDLPLVYGLYPKKEDAANPCVGTFGDVELSGEDPLLLVRRAGRGYMKVQRNVLEKMKEDVGGPALRYHNHGRIEWDFFPSGPVTGSLSIFGTRSSNPDITILYPKDEDGFPMREWISEDWYFCERARALGIKTLVDTSIALRHVGIKEYCFNPAHLARMDADIKSWREIHGWFDYERFYRDIANALREKALSDNVGVTRFVEVGCWLGRSIGAIHEFINEAADPISDTFPILNVDLHVVDTFGGKPDPAKDYGPFDAMQRVYLAAHGGNVEKIFRANMESLGVPVTIHAKPSVEAAADFDDASCDAIFIDGDHLEAAVSADIQAWLPKVRPGGILSGHDIDEHGVAAAVNTAFSGPGPLRAQVFGRCWYVNIPADVADPDWLSPWKALAAQPVASNTVVKHAETVRKTDTTAS